MTDCRTTCMEIALDYFEENTTARAGAFDRPPLSYYRDDHHSGFRNGRGRGLDDEGESAKFHRVWYREVTGSHMLAMYSIVEAFVGHWGIGDRNLWGFIMLLD